MRKILFSTTALATVVGTMAVASADVSISGATQWRYLSVSDTDQATSSDNDFNADHDVTISFSSTADNGLTMGMSQNFSNDAYGTITSSISGDFGTISWSQGSGSAHAAGAFDVTSVGIAGGHGDGGFTVYDGSNTAVTGVSHDEAHIEAVEDGVLAYYSPSFSGFSFGVSVSHLDFADANQSNSAGAKYSGSFGDVSYTVGAATYDGISSTVEGSAMGANVSMGDITVGFGSSSNRTSSTSKEDKTSYSINYAMNDQIILNVGHADSENHAGSTNKDLSNTTVGISYAIAPGLSASLSSHSFDYKQNSVTVNDGSAIDFEIQMSF
jgi:hypothetical protein